MKRVEKLAAQVSANECSSDQKKKFSILQGSEKFAEADGNAGVGTRSIKDSVSEQEWALRVDLAAAYRIVAMNGWDDSINNHISARVPGTNHFLINCMGLGFEEISASNLVKIDANGKLIQAGSAGDAVNAAGFVIHSACHQGVDHAHCVAHTHEGNVTAVSADPDGLLPVTQTALLCGTISYHEFEGVAVSLDERERLVKDMKPNSNIMLLRNHGVLTIGRTIPQCITALYYIHKACEIQVKLRSQGTMIHPVGTDVQNLVKNKQAMSSMDIDAVEMYARATFEHMKRRVRRANPGFDL